MTLPITLIQLTVPLTSVGARWDSDKAWDADYAWDDDSMLTASGTQDFWFSDGRYVSADDAVMAEARIGSEITFSRKASTIYWGGGRASQGLGAIELINTDGGLDNLLFMALRRAIVTVYLGDQDQPLASLSKVARAVVERPETIGEQALRLVLADASSELDIPILSATYSTGAQEGALQPFALGACLSVPALHTGAPSLQFSVHDADTLTAINAVRDSGVTLTPVTQWTALNSGEQHGFTLLQSTAGVITADVTGPSSTDIEADARTLRRIVEALLVTRLGWDSSRVDLAGLDALETELGGIDLGRWVSGATTYAEVLTELMDSIGGWWYIDPSGVVRCDVLRLPSGTPVLELDETTLASDISLVFDTAPGLSDAVLGQRNAYVHDASALAGSVRDTAAGVALSRQHRVRQTFALPTAYASARSAAPEVRSTLASDARQTTTTEPESGMPSLLTDPTQIAAEAARRATLYGGPRWLVSCSALLSALDAALLERGDVVTLTSERYQLSAGRSYCVQSVSGRVGDGLVDLVLWGDGPEVV